MENLKSYLRAVGGLILNGPYLGTSLDIDRFNRNPDNSYLVSFPRTGSHWLRMVIELYFGRPLLRRTFFYPGRKDYLLLHTHDNELDVVRQRVIYLYRDPVDTVFSQLNYYHEPLDNRLRILHWTERYACHLAKWLIEDLSCTQKTALRYDLLQQDFATDFSKVCAHFGVELDASRLEQCLARVTKNEVERATIRHDPRVIPSRKNYEVERQAFRHQQSEFVWDRIRKISHLLYGTESTLTDLFSR